MFFAHLHPDDSNKQDSPGIEKIERMRFALHFFYKNLFYKNEKSKIEPK